MNDFMSVLNRLQAAKRKAATREKTQIRSVTVEDEQLHVSQRSGFDDPIQMQQLQQQHRMNLNEIRERQQALASLEQDIGDCNQIFKDLAHMVHDQGDMVDSIEVNKNTIQNNKLTFYSMKANIETATVQVQQGHTQIAQAHYYQTKARQKKLILGGICIAVLFVLILAFILWLRH
jgi:t-SNARE complex subunit (syntaxin)